MDKSIDLKTLIMKRIGIFYGTTTGTTEEVADMIAKALNVADEDVKNVSNASPSDVENYDLLIFGCSTWGDGDMQEDMHDFLDGVAAMSLKGKEVALFGCGDESMTDTFCNAVGEMYDMLKSTGADFVGDFDAAGYDFEHSKARRADGMMRGLVIDNVNHPERTSERVEEWCKLID